MAPNALPMHHNAGVPTRGGGRGIGSHSFRLPAAEGGGRLLAPGAGVACLPVAPAPRGTAQVCATARVRPHGDVAGGPLQGGPNRNH